MKLIEDIKIKHLAAFVSQQVGKSVSILSIEIDPDIYYHEDDKGELIEGSDYQVVKIGYSEFGENFGQNTTFAEFIWLCESEDLILE